MGCVFCEFCNVTVLLNFFCLPYTVTLILEALVVAQTASAHYWCQSLGDESFSLAFVGDHLHLQYLLIISVIPICQFLVLIDLNWFNRNLPCLFRKHC